MYSSRLINAKKVVLSPKYFQFKTNVNKHGITNSLVGITRWNPLVSGVCIVYLPWNNKPETEYIAVDGHSRTSLAHKLIRNGSEEVYLNCIVLEEAKGIDRPTAKVIGALKNIAENGTSTTPYSIAQLLRSSDKSDYLISEYLNTKNKNLQCAKVLADCSNHLFNLIGSCKVDDYLIAEIFKAYDHDHQRIQALQYMESSKIYSVSSNSMQLLKQIGFRTEQIETLFGTEDQFFNRMLIIDDLTSKAKSLFKNYRAAYRVSNDNQETLEVNGNVIAVENNRKSLIKVNELLSNFNSMLMYDQEFNALVVKCVGIYEADKKKAQDTFNNGLLLMTA